jgi:hypothetical protein
VLAAAQGGPRDGGDERGEATQHEHHVPLRLARLRSTVTALLMVRPSSVMAGRRSATLIMRSNVSASRARLVISSSRLPNLCFEPFDPLGHLASLHGAPTFTLGFVNADRMSRTRSAASWSTIAASMSVRS